MAPEILSKVLVSCSQLRSKKVTNGTDDDEW